MQNKSLLILPFIAILFACGGGEESSNEDKTSNNSSSNEETTAEYQTSFGTCSAAGSSLSMTSEPIEEDYKFSMENLEGVELSSFTTASAELTEEHNTLRVVFVNNPEISGKSLSSFGEEDMSITISIKNNNGELQAGEYSDEDLNIKLTKGFRENNTTKTKAVGSNKTPKSIIINNLSEDKVCGSFKMTTEENKELVSASFDLDVKLVKF